MPYKLLAHIELISKIGDPRMHENRHTIAYAASTLNLFFFQPMMTLFGPTLNEIFDVISKFGSCERVAPLSLIAYSY